MLGFIDDINSIIQKDKREAESLRQRGGCFNLFNTLNLNKNELAHSSMLAELLKPDGSHGKGSLFLQKFLSTVKFGFELDLNTAIVIKEYSIGTIAKNYSSGGRIDILITDAHNHAIIIENKIYAPDQKKQLRRYANYAKSSKLEYAIIYLTLDGHEPSELSIGKNFSSDYYLFSYQEDILPWLDECINECEVDTALYSSMLQYSQCIRKLLHLMNKENEKKLLEIASKKENIESILTLFANENSIKRRVLDIFIITLCEKAQEFGFDTKIDDCFCDEKETFIAFTIPSHSKKWALFFGTDTGNNKDMYYGISLIDGASSKIKKTDLQSIPHLWKANKQDKSYPCGWSHFWSETGEKKSGEWHNWQAIETLQAMADGRLLSFITDKVFIPVIESNVLAELEKL